MEPVNQKNLAETLAEVLPQAQLLHEIDTGTAGYKVALADIDLEQEMAKEAGEKGEERLHQPGPPSGSASARTSAATAQKMTL